MPETAPARALALCSAPFITVDYKSNIMNKYLHHVSGLFASRGKSQTAFARLIALGVPRQQVQIMSSKIAQHGAFPHNNHVILQNIIVDAAIGLVIGTGVVAASELLLTTADASLFSASGFIAPLTILGWGAGLGLLLGAAVGANQEPAERDDEPQDWLSAQVRKGITRDQVVLTVETQTEQQTLNAHNAIQQVSGNVKDNPF